MSQTDVEATEASVESQSTPLDLTEHVTSMRERLDAIEEGACDDMDDFDLVELRSELKQLEDAVETVRKEQADAELETRMEPGEKLFGLSRIQSHNKFVKDDPGKVITMLASEGVSWTEFVDLKASKLADLDLDIDIGRYEYTYLR